MHVRQTTNDRDAQLVSPPCRFLPKESLQEPLQTCKDVGYRSCTNNSSSCAGDIQTHIQARSKQCLIGPAIVKLSGGDLGAG